MIDWVSMVDLADKITLHDTEGSVTLPLVNLLRITMVHMTSFFLQYQEETKDSTITGFNNWIKEKLEMNKGEAVLL